MTTAPTPTDTLAVLRRARELVSTGWTQRASARDVFGTPVDVRTKKGFSFCALGAVDHAIAELPYACRARVSPFRCIVALAAGLDGQEYAEPAVMKWNDTPGRTQAEVLALFDRAIAQQETQP